MQSFLCKNLKYLRKTHRINQEKFADKLGIKRSTYAHQEKNGISGKMLPRYSKVVLREFGYSIDYLIENDLQSGGTKIEIIDEKNEIIESLKEIEEKINIIIEKIK